MAASALASVIVWTGPAGAQSSEFKLDESRQWSSVSKPEPGTDAALIADARRLLAEDQPSAAEALLDPWIEANRRKGNPNFAEALLLRGDSRLALEREFKALYDYEEICKSHRESDQFPIAVERELEIAIRYANGLRLRIFGLRWGDPEDVLVELMIRVQERMPKSQLAERAAIELADYYYRRRDLRQSYEMYDLYLQNFPDGPNAIKARQRRIQSDIGRFKGPRYNASELINARVQVEEFVRRHPVEAAASGMNESLISRLDESMAAQFLDSADWYRRTGDEASSKFVLKRVIRDHPRTLSAQRAEEILRKRGWWEEPTPAPSVDDVVQQPQSGEAPPDDAAEAGGDDVDPGAGGGTDESQQKEPKP